MFSLFCLKFLSFFFNPWSDWSSILMVPFSSFEKHCFQVQCVCNNLMANLLPSPTNMQINCSGLAISAATVTDCILLLTPAACAATFRELARLLPSSLQCHVMLEHHQKKARLCNSPKHFGTAEPRCDIHTCTYVKMISPNPSHGEGGLNMCGALREH